MSWFYLKTSHKDTEPNILHWGSNVLFSTVLWKQSRGCWGVYLKSDFISVLPWEQPKTLRKISLLKQPGGPPWLITPIVLLHCWYFTGCHVLPNKPLVPVRCCQFNTRTQKKLLQIQKSQKKIFICSHPPLYWSFGPKLVVYWCCSSFSGLTVNNVQRPAA